MKVTAVVLSWNGKEDTLACLRSLEGEKVDVIVVDNASEDGTADAVTGAEVIRNERNLGYAGGMNVGIQRALERGADFVLLLNNDVEVEPGAIGTLTAADRRRHLPGDRLRRQPRRESGTRARGSTLDAATTGVTGPTSRPALGKRRGFAARPC